MQVWEQELDKYLNFISENPLIHAALIIIASWIVALVLDKVIISYLRKLTSKTTAEFDDQLLDLLHPPLFYSILVLGLSFAANVAKLPENITTIVFPILYTVLLVLWTMFAIRFTKIILNRMAHNQRHFQILHLQTLPLFENLALLVIIALSVYYILSSWDIDMSAWLASAGIVGIAVGFAAKDTLANLFSGVFIMADAPYKIRDYIVLESGERGEVTNIGLRSTRILTRDNIEITVPNSVMGNTMVINESGGPSTKYRIRAKVGVAYGSDIDEVRGILQEIADNEADICSFPLPVVRFRTFGGSSLDFEVMAWISEPAFRGRILDQINTEIYKKFALHNIEIPFAKQDLYIKEFPEKFLPEQSKISSAELSEQKPQQSFEQGPEKSTEQEANQKLGQSPNSSNNSQPDDSPTQK